jgi:hypothetical protein
MATTPTKDRFTLLIHHQYRSQQEGLWVTHHTEACGPFASDEQAQEWAGLVTQHKDLMVVQRDRGDGTQPFVIYYRAGHPQRSVIEVVRLTHQKGNIKTMRFRIYTWLTATTQMRRSA